VDLLKKLVTVENSPIDDQHPKTGLTPLMCAAVRGHEDIAMVMIDTKANLDILNTKDGNKTALMMAAIEGHSEFIEAMISNGADTRIKDSDGMTAAHWAFCMEHREVGLALIKAGGEEAWSIQDDNGSTPRDLLENLDLLYPPNSDVDEALVVAAEPDTDSVDGSFSFNGLEAFAKAMDGHLLSRLEQGQSVEWRL